SPLFNPAREYLPELNTSNTEFVVLSFEGPDPYCRAGGLGVRVTELTRAIAAQGFDTHFYFLGDPEAAPTEQVDDLPLHYHRWSQWISRHYPNGVYEGERSKQADFRATIPRHLVEERVGPAVARGKRVVILSEEWHTADVACDVSDALWRAGLRDDTVMVWNANNTLGFENVDFERLRFTQSLSTVSRWMKHEMWSRGCNPLVLPNGIPARRLEHSPLVDELAAMAQGRLKDRLTLGKVARFDPDKRWLMAVDAAAGLKRMQLPVLFIAKGGLEAHGHDVIQRALAAGLRVRDVRSASRDPRELMRLLLNAADGADMLNIQFYLSEPLTRALFKVADAMLQNSGREPFGLVGLEVMAAGGLVFTGATGEEYARPFDNAVVLDTDDPREVESNVVGLLARPNDAARMRRNGEETARQYTWDQVLDLMLRRLQYLAAPKAS
ncbi:MAG TPA: glycosyltransferase family 4 protein, partial [Armatimonadota bacterium]|nr:glycosyltransferase family 4 protein [Armatimonadota bacterium]